MIRRRLMGSACMTGDPARLRRHGTMDGYPYAQTITAVPCQSPKP